MGTSKLLKYEGWLALTSTIWNTLCYPLPATCIPEETCNKIMGPAIRQALNIMGFCHHFPGALVYAPLKYNGLGIGHINTIQEFKRLQMIISHTMTNTFTGLLYRASLENLIIEAGMGQDVLDMPFQEVECLTTKALIKSTWCDYP